MESAFTLDDSSPVRKNQNFLMDLMQRSEEARKNSLLENFSPGKSAVKSLICFSRALCIQKSQLMGHVEFVLN